MLRGGMSDGALPGGAGPLSASSSVLIVPSLPSSLPKPAAAEPSNEPQLYRDTSPGVCTSVKRVTQITAAHTSGDKHRSLQLREA